MRNDTMVLAAFTAASVEKTRIGGWTNAGSDPHVLDADYYINLARVVERAGFDLLFFDDRLAMPATYGASFKSAVEMGVRAVKLDLTAILGLMTAHTSRIGLGATYSTTYFEPFHVARVFSTLDHLSKGRAVWNVVTSLNTDEAENFGASEHLEHDLRYDRADEFLEIVTGLWESWGADALEIDRETGRYADPDKVNAIDYAGKFLSSRGPLTVPRPPQGWPVLLQAGQSGRGREFASRWADLIFITGATAEVAQQNYAAQHAAFAEVGRTARPAKLLPPVRVIVGATEQIARERKAYLDSIADADEALVLLSELSGVDFSGFPLDEPIPDDLLEKVGGSKGLMKGIIDRVRQQFGPDATARDLTRRQSIHDFVGDPKQVVDEMDAWFQSRACDGFAIMQHESPGSFEDFGRYVVPELRRRGLVPEIESGNWTLRERLELSDRTSH